MEAAFIEAVAAFFDDLLRDVDREPVGVVELERKLAATSDHRAAGLARQRRRQKLIQPRHALPVDDEEVLLFASNDRSALASVLTHFGVLFAHDLANDLHHVAQEWPVEPELIAIARGATQDLSHHVASPFVAR